MPSREADADRDEVVCLLRSWDISAHPIEEDKADESADIRLVDGELSAVVEVKRRLRDESLATNRRNSLVPKVVHADASPGRVARKAQSQVRASRQDEELGGLWFRATAEVGRQADSESLVVYLLGARRIWCADHRLRPVFGVTAPGFANLEFAVVEANEITQLILNPWASDPALQLLRRSTLASRVTSILDPEQLVDSQLAWFAPEDAATEADAYAREQTNLGRSIKHPSRVPTRNELRDTYGRDHSRRDSRREFQVRYALMRRHPELVVGGFMHDVSIEGLFDGPSSGSDTPRREAPGRRKPD